MYSKNSKILKSFLKYTVFKSFVKKTMNGVSRARRFDRKGLKMRNEESRGLGRTQRVFDYVLKK